MQALYDRLAKPLLYSIEDPERAHKLATLSMNGLLGFPGLRRAMEHHFHVDDDILRQRVLGRQLDGAVLMGAGVDKRATLIGFASALGLNGIEVGTFTPKPQEGNPRPRMRRHEGLRSFQNRMGFNNDGGKAAFERVNMVYPGNIIIGVSIGPNKETMSKGEDAIINDYRLLARLFGNTCDYLAINVSSPNTAGLREQQNNLGFVKDVIRSVKQETGKPVLIKISPDLPLNFAIEFCKNAASSGIDGIIMTNTTTDYSAIPGSGAFGGGLSGSVLEMKSMRMLKAVTPELPKNLVKVSSGGVSTDAGAYMRIGHGASFVQVVTGLFENPFIARDINEGLARYLRNDGFDNISEAIGWAIRK